MGFKAEDKVVCIDDRLSAGILSKGEVYTISDFYMSDLLGEEVFELKEVEYRWRIGRFKLAQQLTEEDMM